MVVNDTRRAGRGAAALVLAQLLSGCVAYHPQPAATPALVAAQDERSLDPAAVAARVAVIAPAAPRPASGWDRLDFFAAMTLYSPAVAAARAAVATAAANARAARAAPGPTLTLTSEYAHDVTTSSPWLIGGLVDVPLDIGGRRTARLATADLATLSARYDLAETVWQQRMMIRRSLAGELIAARQIDLLEALAALRTRQLDAAERRLAAGEIARGDVERVRSDGANVARRRRDAEAAMNTAHQGAAAAIGVRAPALGRIAPAWTGFDTPAADPWLSVDAETRRKAILSRADVLKAIADYQAAEATLRGEVAKQFPAITLSPGYTWERGLVKIPFSLGLVLPPLDLNRRAIRAAEAQREEAGKRLEKTVADAVAAIDAAIIETRAARAALAEVRSRERPVAERLAHQADLGLKAGTVDRVDWAAAQAGAAEARLAELDALARVHAADAALEDAVRRPLEGPETAITAIWEGRTP